MSKLAVTAVLLIVLTTGCTQMGVGHTQTRNWNMKMESEECVMEMSLDAGDIATDTSVTVKNLAD